MSLFEWCQWLEQTPPAIAIAESIWLFPLIEGSHILALPLSVGMIMFFDLHLLGLTLAGMHSSKVMTELVRYVRPFNVSTALPGDQKWRLSKDGVLAMLHWRADGREVFWRGLNLESNELLVMSVDVTTTPAVGVGTPKLLFKLPGPIGGNLGNISRDGQRFIFAVNVSAAATTSQR